MHTRFHGVPQDAVEAMKWIRKAAEQGHRAAHNNLGVMYRDGDGVPDIILPSLDRDRLAVMSFAGGTPR